LLLSEDLLKKVVQAKKKKIKLTLGQTSSEEQKVLFAAKETQPETEQISYISISSYHSPSPVGMASENRFDFSSPEFSFQAPASKP
jgi:hypothetical protein